jgi:hypothetical protein
MGIASHKGRSILRAHRHCVEAAISDGGLDLAFDLTRVITNQTQHRLDASATLRTTAAGFVNLHGPLAAALRNDLSYSFIGQRVA